MITLEPITDKLYLLELLQKDNLFVNIFGSNDLAEIQNTATFQGWFKAIENHNLLGIINIRHFAGNCFMFHAGIYKQFRGLKSEQYLTDILKNLKNISPGAKFIATVNETNKLAARYLTRAGFKKTMIMPNGGTNNQDLFIFAENN